MEGDWKQISEDYRNAKMALWDSPHTDHWSRDEENGYYFMWKAYREAKRSDTKNHLLYARILMMVSRERRFHISEYERFHKYVRLALDEYHQAMENGQRPTEKELRNAQWEYDALSYRESCADAPYEERIKIVQGYEKLANFVYDSQVIAFSHSEHCASLTLRYGSTIATVSFDDVYDIQISADPAVTWITEFSCYPCFEDKSMINFDVGDYRIKCKSISVKSVEFEPLDA